jgi:hypothetical protein
MAISKTSTLNKALTLVGAAPITNIDDDTNNARVASRVYEITRRSFLSECCWNVATTRCTLSLSAKTMPWSYTDELYVYVRPANIIRIFDVSDTNATWREEGDYIISDTNGLGIKGVWDLDDPAKYSASMLDAFVDLLCANICYMIVNSATKAEAFLSKYEKISLNKALAENAQTGTQQVPKDDEWLESKFSNGRADLSYG